MIRLFVTLTLILSISVFLSSCRKGEAIEKPFCTIAKEKFPDKVWKYTTSSGELTFNSDSTIYQPGCPTGYWHWTDDWNVWFSKSDSEGKFQIVSITDNHLKTIFLEHNSAQFVGQTTEWDAVP